MNNREYQAEQSDALDPVPLRRLPRFRRWGERTRTPKPRLWLGGGAGAAGRAIAQRPSD
jgi:hypothetical protein